jgi:hypothetical protein
MSLQSALEDLHSAYTVAEAVVVARTLNRHDAHVRRLEAHILETIARNSGSQPTETDCARTLSRTEHAGTGSAAHVVRCPPMTPGLTNVSVRTNKYQVTSMSTQTLCS